MIEKQKDIFPSYRKPSFSGPILLEMMVAIIIVIMLTSIGLKKLWGMVEFSRSTEALTNIESLRFIAERCVLMSDGRTAGCAADLVRAANEFKNSPNAHFDYFCAADSWPDMPIFYEIHAIRNDRDGGDGKSEITMYICNNVIRKCGTGVWKRIGKIPCPGYGPESCGKF